MSGTRTTENHVYGVISSSPALPSNGLDFMMEEDRETFDVMRAETPLEQPAATPVTPSRLFELVNAPTSEFFSLSSANLPLITKAIKRLKEIKGLLHEDQYNKMAANIERANSRLAKACYEETEQITSCLYPRECLRDLESISEFDKKFMMVLLRSGRVKECRWPTFAGLTDKTSGAPEYQFMIGFEFGFPVALMYNTIREGCKKIDVPDGICSYIADFVGDSYFEIKLTVYFDKTKADWNEQDGEAWIFHKGEKDKIEDVVNFDKTDRIYYVENWPLKGLVVGQSETMQEARQVILERKLVTWLCCQIIWFVLGENLSSAHCDSYIVRNAVKKLIFVLKGWFTGLLLGESFESDGIRFEIGDA